MDRLVRKDGEYYYAGKLADLKARRLACANVCDRPISLFYANGSVYALDARCYHAGGPLWKGQIDDIENFGCVVTCPYHSYKIRLETGERIYKDLSHAFKIAGKRQRTHQVKVKKDRIYVRISTPQEDDDEFDCDRYSTYAIDQDSALGL